MAAEYIVNGMQRKARFTVADAIDGYIRPSKMYLHRPHLEDMVFFEENVYRA